MLQKEELNYISESIKRAESHTSGEIRVCVTKHCKGDPLEAAWKKFKQLKMDATQQRNGVLIYVSPADHKSAIVGDKGIRDVAREDFWEDTLQEMLSFFRKERIAEGISKGVEKVGELLKNQFPVIENDVNELGDEVILE
jgi:uncharacterized membrane protein